MTNNDAWEIQLTRVINFMSTKDTDKKCVIHSKSGNTEILIGKKHMELSKNFLNDFFPYIKLA